MEIRLKKILLILPLLIFLLPTKNASAAIIDLVSGATATDVKNGIDTLLITDGDSKTAYGDDNTVFENIYIPFNVVVSRDSVIEYYAEFIFLGGGNATLAFVDSNDNEIGKTQLTRNRVVKTPASATTSIKGVMIVFDKPVNLNRFMEFKMYYDDAQNSHMPINYEPVENLNAIPNYNYIDLSWDNPANIPHTSTVIKRDGVQIAEVPKTDDAYKNINLKDDTTYVYEVVAKYSDGGLSKPETVTVITNKKPVTPPQPAIAGATYEKLASGEYELKWSDPVIGDVHVDVGGVQYAIVPAANGTLIIPAATMQYTTLGAPDVEMTPVENGLTGRKVRPQRVGGVGAITGFSVFELILATFGLIGMLGWIVLLSIALDWTPNLVGIIKRNGGAMR